MSSVRWADRGESASAKHEIPVHILRSKQVAVFLGDVVTAWVHWDRDEQCSKPCIVGDCQWCKRAVKPRCYGYAPVMLYAGKDNAGGNVWKKVVLAIPPGSLHVFGDPPLRGRMYDLFRVKIGSVEQLRAKLRNNETVVDPSEPWFDVRPILEKIWFPMGTDTSNAADASGQPQQRVQRSKNTTTVITADPASGTVNVNTTATDPKGEVTEEIRARLKAAAAGIGVMPETGHVNGNGRHPRQGREGGGR